MGLGLADATQVYITALFILSRIFLPRGMMYSRWLWFPIERLKVGGSRVLETVFNTSIPQCGEEEETRSKALEVSPFDEQLSVPKLRLRRCLASTRTNPYEASLPALQQTSPAIPDC